MNLAFSALLLLLLILPGIIITYTYTRGLWRWNSPISFQSLTDQIPLALVYAGVLHLLWAAIITKIFSFTLDRGAVLRLILNEYGKDGKDFEPTIASTIDNLVWIILYLLGLYFASGLLGYGAHALVRAMKLDRKTMLFRFKNEWHYLLSGEILEFTEYEGLKKHEGPIGRFDGTFFSTVVQQHDHDYLYCGNVAN